MELKLGFRACVFFRNLLLIVPYGIETSTFRRNLYVSELLIVPYGIETGLSLTSLSSRDSFNRTLWN